MMNAEDTSGFTSNCRLAVDPCFAVLPWRDDPPEFRRFIGMSGARENLSPVAPLAN